MATPSLSKILNSSTAFRLAKADTAKSDIQKLQLSLLTIQQSIWHQKQRAIIVFEGFDAAGKGGAIRKITEVLDPRGARVYPIGAPTQEELNKHWLNRFWTKLPDPGTIAIFDRSWYGRVLVERVDKLTDVQAWQRAYSEINQFEKMLHDDGVTIIKFFLAITKDEQLKRFEARINDPYKQWKISEDDLRARKKWNQYVIAVDQMFKQTSKSIAPWRVIAANDKTAARRTILKTIVNGLHSYELWMKKQAEHLKKRTLAEALKELRKK